MSSRHATQRPLERAAWVALVACVAVVPLAVSKLPGVSQPFTFTSFAYPQTVVLLVGASLALALWAVALGRGETPLVLSRPMIAFGVFGVWAAVATAAAYEPVRSLLGKSTSSLSLMQIVAYCVVFFLVTQLVTSRQRMRTLTWAVVAPASLVGAIALLQQLFGADIFGVPRLETWFVSRGFSTLGNPDHLGTFLVLPVLLSALIFLLEAEARQRWAALGCFAVLLCAATGTLSRGAWAATIAGGLLALVVVWPRRDARPDRRRVALLLGVSVAAVALALVASDPSDLPTRFAVGGAQGAKATTTLDAANAVSSDRINVWRASLAIAAERPLTGTGPAAYELGWYTHAIAPTSGGGTGAIADDPHSVVVYVLATTGIPGALLYLAGVVWMLAFGLKTASGLAAHGPLAGKSADYVAWFVAAAAVQVALLVGAVSTPIVMYAFLTYAMVLRPAALPAGAERAATTRYPSAAASIVLALLLLGSIWPSLAAEVAMSTAFRTGAADRAGTAASAVPWNLGMQSAYYNLRVTRVNAAAATGAEDARTQIQSLVADLTRDGARQPREYYYPSVRAQVLSQASEKLRDPTYAEAAVEAADDALAIMPASIPTRVHRALALSDLGRWTEMADTLAGYWRNELSSAYPGILYAQALALSGDPDGADAVFDALEARFPADTSVADARAQTARLLEEESAPRSP